MSKAKEWRTRILLAIAFIVGSLIVISNWQHFADKLGDAMDGTFRLILILAGLAIFVLVFWRSVIAQKQAHSAIQSQYSDRFARAVEQMVDDRLAIRLGGLALFRALLATREYILVWNYLGDFLRYPISLRDWSPEGDATMPIGQRPDIASIIAMIHERDPKQMEIQGKEYLPLSKANLRGADLQGLNLQGVNLQGADLQDAALTGANLRRTILKKTSLESFDMQGTNLQEADLRQANLMRADISGANLMRADLQEAKLQGANLHRVKLQGAKLQGANLQGINLQGAHLHETDLQEADLMLGLFGSADGNQQDLRTCENLLPEQMKGTFYPQESPLPLLPDAWEGKAWPEDCKPQAISLNEWKQKRDKWLAERGSQ